MIATNTDKVKSASKIPPSSIEKMDDRAATPTLSLTQAPQAPRQKRSRPLSPPASRASVREEARTATADRVVDLRSLSPGPAPAKLRKIDGTITNDPKQGKKVEKWHDREPTTPPEQLTKAVPDTPKTPCKGGFLDESDDDRSRQNARTRRENRLTPTRSAVRSTFLEEPDETYTTFRNQVPGATSETPRRAPFFGRRLDVSSINASRRLRNEAILQRGRENALTQPTSSAGSIYDNTRNAARTSSQMFSSKSVGENSTRSETSSSYQTALSLADARSSDSAPPHSDRVSLASISRTRDSSPEEERQALLDIAQEYETRRRGSRSSVSHDSTRSTNPSTRSRFGSDGAVVDLGGHEETQTFSTQRRGWLQSASGRNGGIELDHRAVGVLKAAQDLEYGAVLFQNLTRQHQKSKIGPTTVFQRDCLVDRPDGGSYRREAEWFLPPTEFELHNMNSTAFSRTPSFKDSSVFARERSSLSQDYDSDNMDKDPAPKAAAQLVARHSTNGFLGAIADNAGINNTKNTNGDLPTRSKNSVTANDSKASMASPITIQSRYTRGLTEAESKLIKDHEDAKERRSDLTALQQAYIRVAKAVCQHGNTDSLKNEIKKVDKFALVVLGRGESGKATRRSIQCLPGRMKYEPNGTPLDQALFTRTLSKVAGRRTMPGIARALQKLGEKITELRAARYTLTSSPSYRKRPVVQKTGNTLAKQTTQSIDSKASLEAQLDPTEDDDTMDVDIVDPIKSNPNQSDAVTTTQARLDLVATIPNSTVTQYTQRPDLELARRMRLARLDAPAETENISDDDEAQATSSTASVESDSDSDNETELPKEHYTYTVHGVVWGTGQDPTTTYKFGTFLSSLQAESKLHRTIANHFANYRASLAITAAMPDGSLTAHEETTWENGTMTRTIVYGADRKDGCRVWIEKELVNLPNKKASRYTKAGKGPIKIYSVWFEKKTAQGTTTSRADQVKSFTAVRLANRAAAELLLKWYFMAKRGTNDGQRDLRVHTRLEELGDTGCFVWEEMLGGESMKVFVKEVLVGGPVN